MGTTFGCLSARLATRRRRPNLLERDGNEKQKQSSSAGPSVTIGLAFFPTLDYSKDKILANACKALEHAKFFGPDSLVSFDAISLNISGDRLYDQGEYQKAIDEVQKQLWKLDPANAEPAREQPGSLLRRNRDQ
ncbi:MAG: hypothetical protein U5R30_04310 [Deltaproteobacteria bacterium]|nr:hypothetical protein [Deltaproteobacteria bacterium]